MRADLLHLIFRRARVEGEHLIWPSGNYSIQYNRKVYNIKAVLRGEEEMGLRYKNTCGVSRCVFSGHNEPHERTKTKNFRNCAFCGRAIRPWGS